MIENLFFRRCFSVNPFRTLSIPMGEMSFFKNWAEDKRGDPYPVLLSYGSIKESTGDGTYRITSQKGGKICRLTGGFFPWNTYDINIPVLRNGTFALLISDEKEEIRISISGDGRITVISGETVAAGKAAIKNGCSFSVTFRTDGLTVFDRTKKGQAAVILDVTLPVLSELRKECNFSKTTASVYAELEENGEIVISEVKVSVISGMSHADLKPVRYEDGTVIIENGRIFLTASARDNENCFQTVLSWLPGTTDFRMEGAMFFDCGDGIWCSDVASSVIYDRTEQRWLIWMCAFSHGHRLARAALENDPRFGISVIDVQLMEYGTGDRKAFEAITGDEDPDLILTDGKWHLAVCRPGENDGYHYAHFVSDEPLDGFTYVGQTAEDEKTGGLFVRTEKNVEFVCGSDFHKRSVYDIYPLDDFGAEPRHIQCDHDDGGFRGWGTVMFLPYGTRYKYVWLTFDRHNCSDYNWSYGNIHVFETQTVRYNKKR